MQYQHITVSGFPHSEISGSKFTYNSPKHIVVRHVLHRLLVPRHSPCALNNLTTICLLFYPNLMSLKTLLFINLNNIKNYVTLIHYLVFKELFQGINPYERMISQN